MTTLDTTNKEEVPKGATHKHVCYSTTNYYCVVPDFVGPESGTQYHCWAWWNGQDWVKDKTVSSRNFQKL